MSDNWLTLKKKPGTVRPMLTIVDMSHKDFRFELGDFLMTQLYIRGDHSKAIAESVLLMMSAPYLKYHVPAHVLRMFEFAKVHNINLSVVEKLAIWFHDAIYYPGKNGIESASVDLMYGFLKPHIGNGFGLGILRDAEDGIMATAEHFLPTHSLSESSLRFSKVMDLDLCNFALERDQVWALAMDVKEEYKGIWTPQGSAELLSKFVDGRTVFRSKEFVAFEEKAASNLKWLISELRAMGAS